MNPKIKILLILLICALVFGLGIVLAIETNTHFIRHWVDDVFYDNYNHYLPCELLPTQVEVEVIISAHLDTLQIIEQLNPGLVVGTWIQKRARIKLTWYSGMGDMRTEKR